MFTSIIKRKTRLYKTFGSHSADIPERSEWKQAGSPGSHAPEGDGQSCQPSPQKELKRSVLNSLLGCGRPRLGVEVSAAGGQRGANRSLQRVELSLAQHNAAQRERLQSLPTACDQT